MKTRFSDWEQFFRASQTRYALTLDLDLEVLVGNIRFALENTHNLRLCLV
ncbi:unnamed protein product, partial [Vitis vinifera]